MKENHYAVIMAGGVGSRFWPVSTQSFPKQFHDMLGAGQTLLQKTYHRLQRFIPKENILILTNKIYKDLVIEQLPESLEENIILEPTMRNTAPCILYAAMKIQQRNPKGIMLVAPSDHWIENEKGFEQDIQVCFENCNGKDNLMTLGIQPSFPNTGYGYIQYEKGDKQAIKKVVRFTEKPDYSTAKSFIEQGNYLWNAGIFIWSVESILKAFQSYQSDMYQLFLSGESYYNTPKEADFIEENYPKADSISIDYAIMEPSKNIYVYPAHFDWNDLGTWGSLHEKLEKDESHNATVNAKVFLKNATNNMIRTEDKKVVIIEDLEGYIIVDKKEVLMIYPKDKEQNIKELRSEVKDKFGDNLG